MKDVLHKVFKGKKKDFLQELDVALKKQEKRFIITANPEILMLSQNDKTIHEMLMDANTTIVADGIGVVKASQMILNQSVERIAGVDIVSSLFEIANIQKKHIFILGSTQYVLDQLQDMLKDKFPNIILDGMVHGYVENQNEVFEQIVIQQPDIVLVALGVPKQELLIYTHLSQFTKGIFVGIGGSLDVLSGTKKRAPQIFIKLNLEWLYRIMREPQRINRFYKNNVKFIFEVRKEKRNKL